MSCSEDGDPQQSPLFLTLVYSLLPLCHILLNLRFRRRKGKSTVVQPKQAVFLGAPRTGQSAASRLSWDLREHAPRAGQSAASQLSWDLREQTLPAFGRLSHRRDKVFTWARGLVVTHSENRRDKGSCAWGYTKVTQA